jgi:hypothetical protein
VVQVSQYRSPASGWAFAASLNIRTKSNRLPVVVENGIIVRILKGSLTRLNKAKQDKILAFEI